MDHLHNIGNYRVSEDTSNNLEINLLGSYMDFLNNSNTSIHHMLSLIDDQQSSFSQILRHYNIMSIPNRPNMRSRYLHSHEYNHFSAIPSTIIPSTNTNPLRRSFNPRAHTGHVTVGARENIVNYLFQDISNQSTARPSQNEIDAATERVLYQNIINPINHSCPISQVDFSDNDTVILLKDCRHIFSATSILQWFERNTQCPLCRHDIRATRSVDTTEETIINSPSSTPLPFAQHLATIISNQLTSDRDFSGNINIELEIPRH